MKVFSLKARWIFKYLVFIPVLVIIVLNMELISNIREYENFYNQPNQIHINEEIEKFKKEIKYKKSELALSPMNKSSEDQFISISKLSKKSLDDLEKIKKTISNSNANPIIRNKHFIDTLLLEEINLNKKIKSSTKSKWINGPNKSSTVLTTTKFFYKPPKFFVILVQVHSRLNYLKELITSLKSTKYIEEALVIFSHDIYDPEMNELIRGISFCAVN